MANGKITTTIESCFDRPNIDIPGIWSLIKYECIICNLNKMRDDENRCNDCNFVLNSSTKRKGGIVESRVGCGAKFKEFGLIRPNDVGKYQLLFFLYYPEYNFKLPEMPKQDMFGNIKTENWYWHIHHLNEIYYDDRKDNLCLCLNTEHPFISKSGIINWRFKN